MVDWTDIHPDFVKEDNWGKTYQQIWEETGLTYQDAQEWIPLSFKPKNYEQINQWKGHNLTPQEAQPWIKIGLTPQDARFAAYLREKNYTPDTAFQEKSHAQTYLDCYYPQDQRNTVKELNIKEKKLTGSLDCNDFVNLEKLNCYDNQLTTLNLTNCPQLKELRCSYNNLAELKFPSSAEQLTELYTHNNNLSGDCSMFDQLVNLERLDIGNGDLGNKVKQGVYNRFTGSLKPLQKLTKLKYLNISHTDIDSGLEYLLDSLEYFDCSVKEKLGAKCQKFANLLANEQGIFPQKLQAYKQWKKLNFTEEEIKEWINAGAKIKDHGFVAWLRDTKKLGPEWITNYQEDYQELSERFKKHGLCPECNQPNTGEQWCRACNTPRLQKDFVKWTSHNFQINEFIQKHQLAAADADKFIEWIPYEQFKNVEYLAEGGFGKVYKAQWTEGNIHHWDIKNKQWHRKKDDCYEEEGNEWNKNSYQAVALKSLTNSQDNTKFLQEIANHKIVDDWFNNIVPCYGISQDPDTKDYIMVMKYMMGGNLRQYLSHKTRKLNLKDKLGQLLNLSQGLKDIHSKRLVHRDFHSGNVLKGFDRTACLISDLGLCKPTNKTNQENKIFGVMPYVAPEVLSGRLYTQAADIYSFGMVTYEILSGLPPYYDKKHDQYLGLAICQGLRPQFQIKTPQSLEDLVKRCWNADPKKRPTANELEKTLRKWEEEVGEKESTEFVKQLRVAEEYNKTLPEEVKFPDYQKKMHKGAVYTSRLLPTKEITRLLQTSQETYGSSTISMSSLLDDFSNTSLEVKQTEQIAQIQNNDANIENWTNHHFTPSQAQEWINTNPPSKQNQASQEPAFYTWLRDTKNLTPEQVLNHSDLNALKQEYQTTQQQAHILHKTN